MAEKIASQLSIQLNVMPIHISMGFLPTCRATYAQISTSSPCDLRNCMHLNRIHCISHFLFLYLFCALRGPHVSS